MKAYSNFVAINFAETLELEKQLFRIMDLLFRLPRDPTKDAIVSFDWATKTVVVLTVVMGKSTVGALEIFCPDGCTSEQLAHILFLRLQSLIQMGARFLLHDTMESDKKKLFELHLRCY
jgi:hypothetical protein